jgi:hypothetical protein
MNFIKKNPIEAPLKHHFSGLNMVKPYSTTMAVSYWAPLKNMSSSIGIIPNTRENKSHVPNHQPA